MADRTDKTQLPPDPFGPATPTVPTVQAAGNPPLNAPPTLPTGVPAGATIVAMTPAVQHVPPTPNEAPEGGKFGVREFEFKDGRRVETITYVDAEGKPFKDKDKDGTAPSPAKKGG